MNRVTKKKPNPHLQTSYGFSILELLVVIAILALLTSLIITLSHYTTKKTDGVKCSSNLREIGQSILRYATDHQGDLVPTVWRGKDTTSGPVWFQLLHNAGLFEKASDNNPLWHLNPHGMFTCPSSIGREEGRAKFLAKYPQHRSYADSAAYYYDGTHYGMMSVIAGVNNMRAYNEAPLKIVSFINPSKTMIVGETDYRYILMAGESRYRAIPHDGSYYLNLDGSVNFWKNALPVGSNVTPTLRPFWTHRN